MVSLNFQIIILNVPERLESLLCILFCEWVIIINNSVWEVTIISSPSLVPRPLDCTEGLGTRLELTLLAATLVVLPGHYLRCFRFLLLFTMGKSSHPQGLD